MKKTQPTSLPETVYVYRDEGNSGDDWLSAGESLQECAEKGTQRVVGEYRLVQLHEVTLEVVTSLVTKPIKATMTEPTKTAPKRKAAA